MTRSLGFVLLVLAGGAVAIGAAPEPGAETPVFEEASRILSVEVPVTVVGKDGQPVRGLAADDFEIFDEEDRQAISAFDVVDLAPTARDPANPTPVDRKIDSLRPSERRHFLLLFDFSYSTPAAILKARLAARQFVVEELHPADLVAVATVSIEQGVRLVVTFTPDRAQLARGIDTLGARAPGESSASLDPLRFMVVDPSGLDSTSVAGSGRDGPRSDREEMVLEYLNVIGQQLDRPSVFSTAVASPAIRESWEIWRAASTPSRVASRWCSSRRASKAACCSAGKPVTPRSRPMSRASTLVRSGKSTTTTASATPSCSDPCSRWSRSSVAPTA